MCTEGGKNSVNQSETSFNSDSRGDLHITASCEASAKGWSRIHAAAVDLS